MDDVPIVDDMVVFAAGMRTASVERHQLRTADKEVKTIVVQAYAQPVSDKA